MKGASYAGQAGAQRLPVRLAYGTDTHPYSTHTHIHRYTDTHLYSTQPLTHTHTHTQPLSAAAVHHLRAVTQLGKSGSITVLTENLTHTHVRSWLKQLGCF